MKDARLIEFRRRALRDVRISAQAKVLICLLVEWIYLEPIRAEDEFPMPWSRVAKWTGVEKPDTVRAWFDELDGTYLRRGALRNCPPTRHFFLCLDYPGKRVIDYPADGAIKHPEKGAINYPEKGANYISTPFRKELEPEGKNSSSLRSKATKGESNSSLRSKKEGEDGNSALRANTAAADAAILTGLFASMKKAAGTDGAKDGDKGAFSEDRPKALPADSKPKPARRPKAKIGSQTTATPQRKAKNRASGQPAPPAGRKNTLPHS